MRDKIIIILLGPPGSGKGTQAARISKELSIPHISTGDLFRDHLSRNTPLGELARSYIDKGQLVPDEVVLKMLFDRISHPDCAKGYLLDGFPRTIHQAEAFEQHLNEGMKPIILNLNVGEDIIFKRMAGRLTCKSCSHIHNKYFSPPQVVGRCDKCNGELVQRSDDLPEVVTERLKVYHKQTSPLIDFYKKRKSLITIDGTQPPDVVFDAILQAIKTGKNKTG